LDNLLDEKLADFVHDFPEQHQHAVINIFFENVEEILEYCLDRMSPADAIRYVQQKPFKLVDMDNSPFNTLHLIELYVDFVCEQLQGVKVH
jgi:hypothetical protein